MINLHESMGPGRYQTNDPWICSQTAICYPTHYRLISLFDRENFIFRVMENFKSSVDQDPLGAPTLVVVDQVDR